MTRGIYDAFMTGPEWMVELTHAYTYSAQPLAVAAGLATLDVYAEEGLFQRAADLTPYFEDAIHALKALPNVVDVRNLGMMAAVEGAPREGTHPTARSYSAEERRVGKERAQTCRPRRSSLHSTKQHTTATVNTPH